MSTVWDAMKKKAAEQAAQDQSAAPTAPAGPGPATPATPAAAGPADGSASQSPAAQPVSAAEARPAPSAGSSTAPSQPSTASVFNELMSQMGASDQAQAGRPASPGSGRSRLPSAGPQGAGTAAQGRAQQEAMNRRTENFEPVSGNGYHYTYEAVAHHDRGGSIAEQYRALRTNLLAQHGDEGFVTIITSAEAGEGKTATCVNLAMVLAEGPERRTVLIDCDLRKSRVHRLLAMENNLGMADVLRGTAKLSEVLRPTAYPNLSIITAGQIKPEQVGEILGRPQVAEIVAELRKKYDYVLFDTPPINTVSDAGALGRCVGEAILVVRMNKTRRESVDKAIRLLHAANVQVAGLVLTHQQYYIPSYLYRYS